MVFPFWESAQKSPRGLEACPYLTKFEIILLIPPFEAGRGAAARGVTAKPTDCGFDPHSRRWNIYLNLYFHFLRSGIEVKRGVEFCRSTRNASRIR